MNNTSRLTLAIVLAAAAALAAYFWWRQGGETAAPPAPAVVVAPPPVAPPAPPIAEAAPTIQHPLDTAPTAEPLPALDASDGALAQALAALVGKPAWQTLFFPESIVRRIVATVDNLPRRDAPVKMWPVHPAGTPFATAGSGAALAIAPENARRYAAYVKLAQATDVAALVALYRRFYPLFQQAYVDLGYPQGYFNDRLVAAIDDLLAAPEPEALPRLVQPKVLYEYADPELERRSAGQRIMLRIGTANARSVKARLREIRQAVARI
jgi:hypothetical protein